MTSTRADIEADKIFVEFLEYITGDKISRIAANASVAATTLNRYKGERRKEPPKSSLKVSTIEKVAERYGLDIDALMACRREILKSILHNNPITEMKKIKDRYADGASEVSSELDDPLFARAVAYAAESLQGRPVKAQDLIAQTFKIYGRIKHADFENDDVRLSHIKTSIDAAIDIMASSLPPS